LYVEDLLSEKGLKETGLFDPVQVNKLRDKIRDSGMATEIDNMALAGILSTQLIHHQFVSGNRYKPEVKPLVNCRTLINNTQLEPI
jgi:asparagine synthase (glutamine-hydrolysing)